MMKEGSIDTVCNCMNHACCMSLNWPDLDFLENICGPSLCKYGVLRLRKHYCKRGYATV